MNDLELDPVTGDLLITNGDFSLLNSEAKVARQSLVINLLFFRGEWFLDLDYGLPYFQRILKKGTNKPIIDSIIRKAILDSYNIASIVTFTSEIQDKTTYKLTKFVGTTTDGEIISITNQVLI